MASKLVGDALRHARSLLQSGKGALHEATLSLEHAESLLRASGQPQQVTLLGASAHITALTGDFTKATDLCESIPCSAGNKIQGAIYAAAQPDGVRVEKLCDKVRDAGLGSAGEGAASSLLALSSMCERQGRAEDFAASATRQFASCDMESGEWERWVKAPVVATKAFVGSYDALRGRLDDAEQVFTECLQELPKPSEMEEEPMSLFGEMSYANAHLGLSQVQLAKGEFSSAEDSATEALSQVEGQVSGDSPALAPPLIAMTERYAQQALKEASKGRPVDGTGVVYAEGFMRRALSVLNVDSNQKYATPVFNRLAALACARYGAVLQLSGQKREEERKWWEERATRLAEGWLSEQTVSDLAHARAPMEGDSSHPLGVMLDLQAMTPLSLPS